MAASPLSQPRKSRAGLALREFIVVGVILFFVLLMTAPILVRMRASSRQSNCLLNIQAAARAVAEMENLSGELPGYRNFQLPTEAGSRRVGWVFQVSPFLRTNPAAERFSPGPWAGIHDRHGPGGDPETRGLEPDTTISMLICPGVFRSESTPPTLSSYVANGGLPDASELNDDALPDWPQNGVFLDYTFPNSPKMTIEFIQNRDGADMTLMLSENTALGRWSQDAEAEVAFLWDNAEPTSSKRRVRTLNQGFQDQSPSVRNARPSSFHVGGVNAVFVGGGSRFLSEQIDEKVFVALMTPDSSNLKKPGTGEPLGPPYGKPAAP